MLEIKLKPFAEILDLLVQYQVRWGGTDEQRRIGRIPEDSRNHLIESLQPLIEQLASHGFELCSASLERLVDALGKDDRAFNLTLGIQELRGRLIDQLTRSYCLCLSSSERELYEVTKPPFGDKVEKLFPSVGYDIGEASKCLAFGRGTASVFHSIRCLEA
jgi:hypothetical protein